MRSGATAAHGSCCCSRPGPARGTTGATGAPGRASPLLSRPAALLLRAPLPAVVRKAVDEVRERNEEGRIEHRKGCGRGDVVMAVLRAEDVEEREDRPAEDERAPDCPPPRRLRRDLDRAAAALRLRLRLGLRSVCALLGRRRDELLGRVLDLVALGVQPDGLVLVAALLRHPAPLLPGR